LTLKGGVCENAGIVLGGVAPRPWRAPGAEAALKGKAIDEKTATAAAAAALEGAEPMDGNGYKVDLGKAVVKRAVLLSAASV
jgi:xanthine dehydrogenase YagS FAD-binding subunit